MLKLMKLLVTIATIVVVALTALMLNDIVTAVWSGTCIVIGYALCEMWRLKNNS